MKKRDNHLVSIVLCAKDAEAYLASSIDSILTQTYTPIEIVIVDDGSSDSSIEIVKRYSEKVVLHACDHRGVWAARNFGVEVAKGDFIAFQDADDISFSNRIAIQIEAFYQKAETDIVFGNMVEFSGDENGVLKQSTETLEEIKVPATCPGAMFFSREAFYKVGEFCTQWNIAGFLDWYMRAVDKGLKIEVPSDIILARRIHEANSTSLAGQSLSKEYLHVIRKGLARRNKIENENE